MRGLTIRSGFAGLAIVAAVLGSAATATAAPTGPCEDVTYVGVCEPLREQARMPSQQGMAEVILGAINNVQTVN
jgi:hypothetical protein